VDQPPKPTVSGTTPPAEQIEMVRREAAETLLPMVEQSEEARQVPEDQYRLLFDRTPLPTYIFDVETLAILAVNEAAIRLHGGSKTDLLTRGLKDVRPADEVARLRQYLAAPASPGEGSPRVWRHRNRDGTIGHALVAWERIVFDGRPSALAMIDDVTESESAEQLMRASEKRFRALIERSWDAIALVGEDRRIRYFSPSVTRILGYGVEEFLDRDLFDLVHPDDLAYVNHLFIRILQWPGTTLTAQFRCRHKDGSWRWLESTTTNLLEDPGVQALVINSHDITERKQLDEALQQRARELAEANQSKDEFLAMLAHELRNPLVPIVNSLHILRQEPSANPAMHQARLMAERQVRNMVHLVDDLLDVSRLTMGKIRLRKERVELGLVVDRGVATSRAAIDQRQHQLSVSVPREELWLEGDPIRIEQVLTNLLTNAAKYTDPGGRIQLAVERDGSNVVIRVRDNGIGIDAELLPRIFELFTQGNRSLDRSQGGLGIGLTVARKLVEMHGGAISAASAGLGKGSEFSVRLPAQAARAIQPPPTAVPVSQQGSPSLRVLVVEDNVDAAESLAILLRMFGHQPHVVHTGMAGLDAAATYQPNVILLDIGLPGMDGYEVARRLRQQPASKDVPVIAMSGYSMTDDGTSVRESSFDQYLVKPVEPEKLQEVLLSMANRQPGAK
jgi:PAS domain S-box-containing protein